MYIYVCAHGEGNDKKQKTKQIWFSKREGEAFDQEMGEIKANENSSI